MWATSYTCTSERTASGANGTQTESRCRHASKISERHGEEVFLIPGPTTLAMRSATNSNAFSLAWVCPVNSTASFEAPYGSSDAGGSSSVTCRCVQDDP